VPKTCTWPLLTRQRWVQVHTPDVNRPTHRNNCRNTLIGKTVARVEGTQQVSMHLALTTSDRTTKTTKVEIKTFTRPLKLDVTQITKDRLVVYNMTHHLRYGLC